MLVHFSGKDVDANNSFMVLFEQRQLEVYRYHGEYAEVSATSLCDPACVKKGLASAEIFIWLPVETRAVLLYPPQ